MAFETARELAAVEDTAGALLVAVRQFYAHTQTWHSSGPELPSVGSELARRALHLHALNFDLWHHEDAARSHGAPDREVAGRKRCIDALNARRNTAIEGIDEILLDHLGECRDSRVPLHTETPGTIVDRLSVLTLRIVHTGNSPAAAERLVVLHEQYDDLRAGLDGLMVRLCRGEARFKLYRQFKSAAALGTCSVDQGQLVEWRECVPKFDGG